MTRNEEIRQEALKWKTDDNEFIAQTAFEAGALWADDHPKSPWISPDNSLPTPGEKVLICVNSNSRSTATINPRPYHFEISERLSSAELGRLKRKGWCPCDKYGFPNHGYDTFEVLCWMPIPELPKGGEK